MLAWVTRESTAPGVQAGSGSTCNPLPRAVQCAGRPDRSPAAGPAGGAVAPLCAVGAGVTVTLEQAARTTAARAATIDRVIRVRPPCTRTASRGGAVRSVEGRTAPGRPGPHLRRRPAPRPP